jgi:hypothetical protein
MKKLLTAAAVVLIAALAGIWAYLRWTSPYELPQIRSDIPLSAYRLDFSAERATYEKARAAAAKPITPPLLPVRDAAAADQAFAYAAAHPGKGIAYLQAAVAFNPSNLAYSTGLRLSMTGAGKSKELLAFLGGLDQSIPQIKLQVALAYVDMLQNPSYGTASLGQISFKSIEELNRILEANPYDWAAHYARGINNLYWPVGLKRIDKSIQDLAYCVAVAEHFDNLPPVLLPMSYVALGDALVKKGDVQAGYRAWKDGLGKSPGNPELTARVAGGVEQATQKVADARGMEQFQRPAPGMTDFSKLWSK